MERKRDGGRKGRKRSDDGGGTDVAEKGENDVQLTVGQNQRRGLQIQEVNGGGREKKEGGTNP